MILQYHSFFILKIAAAFLYTATEDTAMRTIYCCMCLLEKTFERHTALVRSRRRRQIWALIKCTHFQPIWLFFFFLMRTGLLCNLTYVCMTARLNLAKTNKKWIITKETRMSKRFRRYYGLVARIRPRVSVFDDLGMRLAIQLPSFSLLNLKAT